MLFPSFTASSLLYIALSLIFNALSLLSSALSLNSITVSQLSEKSSLGYRSPGLSESLPVESCGSSRDKPFRRQMPRLP